MMFQSTKQEKWYKLALSVDTFTKFVRYTTKLLFFWQSCPSAPSYHFQTGKTTLWNSNNLFFHATRLHRRASNRVEHVFFHFFALVVLILLLIELFLRKMKNIRGQARVRLRDLLTMNLRTVKAYLFTEDFDHLWSYNRPSWEAPFLMTGQEMSCVIVASLNWSNLLVQFVNTRNCSSTMSMRKEISHHVQSRGLQQSKIDHLKQQMDSEMTK